MYAWPTFDSAKSIAAAFEPVALAAAVVVVALVAAVLLGLAAAVLLPVPVPVPEDLPVERSAFQFEPLDEDLAAGADCWAGASATATLPSASCWPG